MVRPHSGKPYKRKPPETTIFSGSRATVSVAQVLGAALLGACGAIGTEPGPDAVIAATGASGGPSTGVGTAGGAGSGGAPGRGGTGGQDGSDAAAGSDAGQPPATSAGCGTHPQRVFIGTFDDANWLAVWDPRARVIFGATNLERVPDPTFGTALRVRFPAGSVDPGTALVGGAEFKPRFPPVDGICLSYWLRFDPKFDFVKGGKLPGLCGGDCPSGGKVTNGQTGWSMRYMWRERGAGQEYAYILPPQDFGTELGTGRWNFSGGGWHHIEEWIQLNTPGQADGIVRVWFDRAGGPNDAPVYEVKNLDYRTVATLKIDQLFFSTFFGGHDASWATPIDTFIDFARFELFE